MTVEYLTGDCREVLKTLPEKHFNTVVTSPPYWGLRDYQTGTWVGGDPNCSHFRESHQSKSTQTGHKKSVKYGGIADSIYKKTCKRCGAVREDLQVGLEESPAEYVRTLVRIFREIRRVLRDDGTVWLNLGDSYSSGGRTSTTNQTVRGDKEYGVTRPPVVKGLKQKDLVGIPWRVAFALQEDGWYLRQDIIWHKPNPMPESVQDRCTKAHEYIFLLSKNKNYYYDNEAIKEEVKQDWGTRDRANGKYHNEGTGLVPHGGLEKSYETKNKRSVWSTKYRSDEEERTHRQGMSKTRGEKLIAIRPNLPSQEDFVKFLRSKTNVKILSESTNIGKTTIEHWFRLDKSGFSYPSRDDWIKISDFINDWSTEYEEINQKMTYEEYHFDDVVTLDKKNKRSVWTVSPKPFKEAHFAVYPTELIEPCVLAGCPKDGHVLDPFGGSGTTGLVADRLGRNATLIELNEDYLEIGTKRILSDAPLFTNMIGVK